MQVSKPKKGYKFVDAGFGKFEEIPEEWKYEEFQDIIKKDNTKKIKIKTLDYENKGKIPIIDQGQDLICGYTNDSSLTYGGELPVIVFGDHTLAVKFIDFPFAIGADGTKIIQINQDKGFTKFFYYAIQNRNLVSEGYKRHFSKLRMQKFSYPSSIPEQQKITKILSNVDNTLEKTNQLIQKIELLKKGLMQKLFTQGIGHSKFKKVDWYYKKQIEIPEEWGMKKLEEVAKVTRGKFGHRPRNDPDYYGGKHPFIQTGDVENAQGEIIDYSQTLNEKGLRTSKYFPTNTIVITIAANIGATAITTFPVCFPDSLIGITSKIMNIKFLEYYLRTLKKYLENVAHASAQKNINYQNLKPLLIPVPLLPEQDQIVSILSNVDSQITKEKLQKSNLELLKKGLMQKLLTGKIRVKF